MAAEFDLINQYFRFSSTEQTSTLLDVETGVGDDAAVLNIGDSRFVVATDTLVEGVHFPVAMEPRYVASRAFGVNLSDFAAMGVRPKWLTLSLCVPAYNETWLAEFSYELEQLCSQYSLALVGGDTVRGNLCIGFTVMGTSDNGCLLRSGAQAEDDVWVSGYLGNAAAALALLQNTAHTDWPLTPSERRVLLDAFYKPKPRIELGLSLQKIATSAIDISDGLLADAGHVAKRSSVGLAVNSSDIPVAQSLMRYPEKKRISDWVMRGGDDYELLFTAPKHQRKNINQLSKQLGINLSRIGYVFSGEGILLDGAVASEQQLAGYTHF